MPALDGVTAEKQNRTVMIPGNREISSPDNSFPEKSSRLLTSSRPMAAGLEKGWKIRLFETRGCRLLKTAIPEPALQLRISLPAMVIFSRIDDRRDPVCGRRTAAAHDQNRRKGRICPESAVRQGIALNHDIPGHRPSSQKNSGFRMIPLRAVREIRLFSIRQSAAFSRTPRTWQS